MTDVPGRIPVRLRGVHRHRHAPEQETDPLLHRLLVLPARERAAVRQERQHGEGGHRHVRVGLLVERSVAVLPLAPGQEVEPGGDVLHLVVVDAVGEGDARLTTVPDGFPAAVDVLLLPTGQGEGRLAAELPLDGFFWNTATLW